MEINAKKLRLELKSKQEEAIESERKRSEAVSYGKTEKQPKHTESFRE